MSLDRRVFAFLCLSALLVSPSAAFRPAESQQALEFGKSGIQEKVFERFVRSEERIDPDLQEFKNRFGGNWAIQRDPILGTPHHILGSGFNYVNEHVADKTRAEEIARTFLTENEDLLHLSAGRLGEPWTVGTNGKWSVVFREIYEGLWVYGGRAHVVMTESGRIFAIGSDFHPGMEADVEGLISEQEAVAIAKGDMSFVDDFDFMREDPELFIYPQEEGDGYVYRPTWKVILHMSNPFGGWENWIDANTGEIYARRQTYEMATVSGSIRADVDNPDYCGTLDNLPLKKQFVNLSDGQRTNTSDDGLWSFTTAETGSVTVDIRFNGPRFIQTIANGPPISGDTIDLLVEEVADFYWDDSNSRAAERDAWYHHWVVRDKLQEIDPAMTADDFKMTVNLERTDGFCPGNAWWDGASTNYCLGSPSFANTALLGDVIYHEYGHGISQWTYSGNPFSSAQSEGNSDVISLLLLKRPTLGIGFTNGACNHGIRSASMGYVFPDDNNGSGHHDGQAISAYFWETRNRMITSYGETFTDSLLPIIWQQSRSAGIPSNVQDQVTWTFIYDDNDGDLDTGTPNFVEFAGAAEEIGFTVPVISAGVQITHAGLPSTTDTLSARTVTALVEGLSGGIDPSSVTLYYNVDGGVFSSVSMTATANPDEYDASIPAQVQGSRVQYYVEAADSVFHVNWSPPNAPANNHWYDVVFIYDPCESVGGWTLGDSTDDATKGIWANGDPVMKATRPEDDVTPDGINCFFTGPTGANNEVKEGKTTLYSPFYQLGGSPGVVARYHRWYSNNFGADGPLETLDEVWDPVVSVDGGSSWTEIEHVETGTESWVEVELDLGAMFGTIDSVQFRFVARDTGAPTRIHAGVDEFRFVRPGIATGIGGSADEIAGLAPRAYSLDGNHPNPFNPTTRIAYAIPREGRVTMEVFNVGGRRVRTLIDGTQKAGRYETAWDGTDLKGKPVSSGVYFYKLTSGEFSETKKMLLVK